MLTALPAPASSSAIPFAQPAPPGAPDGSGTFLLTALLLVVACGVLWLLRKRLGGAVALPGSAAGSEVVAVVQRVRVSATCVASVLEGPGARVLVVESRQGLQVLPWPSGDTP